MTLALALAVALAFAPKVLMETVAQRNPEHVLSAVKRLATSP